MLVNNVGMLDIEDPITVSECFCWRVYTHVYTVASSCLNMVNDFRRCSDSALLMRLLFVWLLFG